MDVINYTAQHRVLTIARGHPYDRNAFSALFEELTEFDVCHAEQPLAQQWLRAGLEQQVSAVVCYDMPGVDFTAADAPAALAPTEQEQGDYLALLDAGIGMVYLHHSLAAWPAWPEYADIVGGRFHYMPARLRGQAWPDSGYRHEVTHTVELVADHPVTRGLPETFQMQDELYLCPVFEQDVLPLLRSDADFSDASFFSAARAVAGDMHSREDWSHPAGSSCVGWAKSYGNSPIVYLQGGDDAVALGNPSFKQLVQNAIRWVASPEAHAWARDRAAASDVT